MQEIRLFHFHLNYRNRNKVDKKTDKYCIFINETDGDFGNISSQFILHNVILILHFEIRFHFSSFVIKSMVSNYRLNHKTRKTEFDLKKRAGVLQLYPNFSIIIRKGKTTLGHKKYDVLLPEISFGFTRLTAVELSHFHPRNCQNK